MHRVANLPCACCNCGRWLQLSHQSNCFVHQTNRSIRRSFANNIAPRAISSQPPTFLSSNHRPSYPPPTHSPRHCPTDQAGIQRALAICIGNRSRSSFRFSRGGKAIRHALGAISNNTRSDFHFNFYLSTQSPTFVTTARAIYRIWRSSTDQSNY